MGILILITEHAKKQLKIRFGISNLDEVEHRTINSSLMSPLQVNRCGTKYKIGCTYLRSRDMILVYNKENLINVFYFYNPYRMIKRETQNLQQRSLESRRPLFGDKVQQLDRSESRICNPLDTILQLQQDLP